MTTSRHQKIFAELQERLQFWVDKGAIRALDLAFARFIDQQVGGFTSSAQWLACLLVSERTAHGHVCLDLAEVLAGDQVLLSNIRDLDAASRIKRELAEIQAQIPSPALWAEWLRQCPAITTLDFNDGNGVPNISNARPMVLTGSKDKPLLYLHRYWQYEQVVRLGIGQRLQTIPLPPQTLALLDTIFGDGSDLLAPNWQKIACGLSARSGFSIITGGPGTGKTTTVVRLLALLQGLQLSEGLSPLIIRLAAPTGKAAARLNESIAGSVQQLNLHSDSLTPEQMAQWQPSIPTEVSTLHRLLGSLPNTRHFRHNKANPLPADIVVVDEASMVDVEMMAKLMEALRPDARLILLGDKDQLASVEAGSVLGDLCQQAEDGHYSAETCAFITEATGQQVEDRYRFKDDGYQFKKNEATDSCQSNSNHPNSNQANNSAWLSPLAQRISQATTMLRYCYRSEGKGLLDFAKWVNLQEIFASGLSGLTYYFEQYPEELQHIELQSNQDERDWKPFEQQIITGYKPYLQMLKELPQLSPETLDDWVLTLFEQHKKFQLLSAVRQGDFGVEGLNLKIRQLLAHRQLIASTEQQWYSGRPVLVTQNDYSLKLMNGDIGLCLELPFDNQGIRRFRVAFPDSKGGVRWILPSRLQSVETVFAMTVHKSQGSEFEHTALILPDKINAVLTKELLYTGITRSKKRFTLITPERGVLEMALKQSINRASGLLT
ncbi:exodeoxyribonuclease V subunit alpha [Oceanospirillum maris]|uniref:exodeoxyribonuclease V subunit alpha n=1 Tax=Oceanospirillum maris TaxID=64977 RepID=UPI00041AABE4|nr:exodeoxyribonuclease V subunit alpha [Oceanospirillum maris]